MFNNFNNIWVLLLLPCIYAISSDRKISKGEVLQKSITHFKTHTNLGKSFYHSLRNDEHLSDTFLHNHYRINSEYQKVVSEHFRRFKHLTNTTNQPLVSEIKTNTV